TTSASLRYWNSARQRHCRPSERYQNIPASLPTRSPSHPRKPARKAGFSTFESGCGRETDCLLEGDGFELPVPRELGLRRGRRLALYLGSLTLRRRGPDWNATKRRRDSERRASTAAERGIEKTDELRRLKNAIAVGTPITGRPPGHRRRSPAPGSHRT